MSIDKLLACLQRVQAPSGVEEWLRPVNRSDLSGPEIQYQQAIQDLLVALGVLTTEATATSPTAYYFVQSLICMLQDHALTPTVWDSSAGRQLVHVLEQVRMENAADPTPLRTVRASTALIKARHGDQDVILMQFDEKAQQFQPIGGKQEDYDGSGEAALTRELSEELGIPELVAGRDFKIHPLALNVAVDEISASVHVMTRYYHSFYHLTDVRFAIPRDDITRWLTLDEVLKGRTQDGRSVSMLFEEYVPGALKQVGYSLELPV